MRYNATGLFLSCGASMLLILVSGCLSADVAGEGNATPLGSTHDGTIAFVKRLLERNHLAERAGQDNLPSGKDWRDLAVFQVNGALVVSWNLSPSPYMIARGSPLVFRSDGSYLCQPFEYRIGDVTGDGIPDLVALEDLAVSHTMPAFALMVYPLGKEAAPARFLGTVYSDYACSPKLVDFRGDGVYEIVAYVQEPQVQDLMALGKGSREKPRFFATVWSVKDGFPRLILACANRRFDVRYNTAEGDVLQFCVDEAAEEGRLDKYVNVMWDAKQGKFDIGGLEKAGAPVFVNRGMSD